MTRDRCGAFVTLIGAVALLAVLTNWPDNRAAAGLAAIAMVVGVGIRL
jgi:hypothetical protein